MVFPLNGKYRSLFGSYPKLFVSGSAPNVNSICEIVDRNSCVEKASTYGEMLVEKIHGIHEKLMGHHRSDSDCSTRAGKTGRYHLSY